MQKDVLSTLEEQEKDPKEEHVEGTTASKSHSFRRRREFLSHETPWQDPVVSLVKIRNTREELYTDAP